MADREEECRARWDKEIEKSTVFDYAEGEETFSTEMIRSEDEEGFYTYTGESEQTEQMEETEDGVTTKDSECGPFRSEDYSEEIEEESTISVLRRPPSPPPQVEEPGIALLPPDHPLLQRFQEWLKGYLVRSKEELMDEIAEMKYQVKLKETEHQNEGSKLFDLQTDIRHQEEQLDAYTAQIQEHVEKRRIEEESVEMLKIEFKEKDTQAKNYKKTYDARMMELENLQVLESNLNKWTAEAEDEVKNAKRIVTRDEQIQRKLAEDQKKCDFLSYHLDVEIKKNERELETIRSEHKDMSETVEVLHQSISAATADLEVLQGEHKRLTQAWNEVIIAIGHRDKILFQLNAEMEKVRENIKLSKSGIEAAKKHIQKETNLNEKLQNFRSRIINDCQNLQRDCQRETEILRNLEQKLDELPLLLDQTEKDLNEATKESYQLANDLRHIEWTIDKQNAKKFDLEDSILKSAQDQLITDKASEYRLKLLNKSQEKRRHAELTLTQTQNQLASTLFELEKIKGILFKMQGDSDELKKQLEEAENSFDELSKEDKVLLQQIDLKTKRLAKLQDQLDELLQNTEDVRSSPTVLKIKALEKTLTSAEQQIREYQQFWLMLQNHYVNLSNKRSIQLKEMQVTRKQQIIIKQKSVNIDLELEKAEDTAKELNQEINLYMNKLSLLNSKVFKKREEHQIEESQCEKKHAELVIKLRENEMQVLALESEINDIQTEIENLKDQVLDKHREALSWETKYKLVDETLRWLKDETNLSSEIGVMKTEIHHMRVRLNQLKRAQEKLTMDLTHCVMHREHTYVAVNIKRHLETKTAKAKSCAPIQYKVVDLRNKLKQIKKEADILETTRLVELKSERSHLEQEIKRLQEMITNEIMCCNRISEQIEQFMMMKHLNLDNIVCKQARAKSFRRLSTEKGEPKSLRSSATILTNIQRQLEINERLQEVLSKLETDSPREKNSLTKLAITVKNSL